jgi:hypothetical protein
MADCSSEARSCRVCTAVKPMPRAGRARRVPQILCVDDGREVRIDIPALEHVDAWENITIGSALLDNPRHDIP